MSTCLDCAAPVFYPPGCGYRMNANNTPHFTTCTATIPPEQMQMVIDHVEARQTKPRWGRR